MHPGGAFGLDLFVQNKNLLFVAAAWQNKLFYLTI